MPSLNLWEAIEFRFCRAHQNNIQSIVPRYKCKACNRHLVSYKPFSVRQILLKHAANTFCLFDAKINSRGKLLAVKYVKPALSQSELNS